MEPAGVFCFIQNPVNFAVFVALILDRDRKGVIFACMYAKLFIV